MPKDKNPFLGRWSIIESDLLESDQLNLIEPAFIEFRKNRTGDLIFGAVEGDIDYRIRVRNHHLFLEFTWSGMEEGDLVSGRGWVKREINEIYGQIFTHLSDEVSFKAVKHTRPRNAV